MKYARLSFSPCFPHCVTLRSSPPLQARGAVEKWLLEVEERMFEGIHYVTGLGMEVRFLIPRVHAPSG